MLFFECDYPTLELYTLAQCCISWLGQSKLAEALKNGLDPHLWVAAIILKKSYEWCLANKQLPEVKRARFTAKAANFGFPGGMGAKKFVLTTRKNMMRQGMTRAEWDALELDEARAKLLKEQWYAAWPEMPFYFARVNALCDNAGGFATTETLFTGRWRGRATYCATANNGFQALGADCAKNAGWLITEAQYTQRSSPLYNTRTPAFVHDEFIGEGREEQCPEAAVELGRLMIVGANEFLPDCPIPFEKMDPLMMKRWSKKAESRKDHNGRLIAWAA
jgi:DNA polymerase-1